MNKALRYDTIPLEKVVNIMGDDNMNQNELAVFAYACQLLLKNKLYNDLNDLLEFAKNKGAIVTPPSNSDNN